MTAAGLAAIERAKKNGAWMRLEAIDLGEAPKDLLAAFRRHKGSKAFFDAFPPSTKRAILEWIVQAKTPETRSRRVEETARLAAKNIRANQYRQPKSATPKRT